MKLKQRFIPSEDTLEERLEVFRDKLFREIKCNLFSNKRQDPTISIQIEIELDEFEHFTKFGNEFQDRGKTKYKVKRNVVFEEVFGYNWDVRILNKYLDFSFVTPGTIEVWLKERKPILEFSAVGGTGVPQEIEQKPLLVFSFTRGDGTKTDYKETKWCKSTV